MSISTTSLAEPFAAHPVHRATAMLRYALLTAPPESSQTNDLSDEQWDDDEAWYEGPDRLFAEPVDTGHEPMIISPPESMATCLHMVSPSDEGSSPSAKFGENSEADATVDAKEDSDAGDIFDQPQHIQLRGLVRDFHERQRQAGRFVTISVAAACVMTLGGLAVLLSIVGPAAAGG